jgi:hypothetical protein
VRKSAAHLGAALAVGAAFLFSGAGSAPAEVVADLNPEPPRVAYVTETATSTPKVWVA